MGVEKFAVEAISKIWKRTIEESSCSPSFSSAIQQILHPNPILFDPMGRFYIQRESSGTEKFPMLPTLQYPQHLRCLELVNRALIEILKWLVYHLEGIESF